MPLTTGARLGPTRLTWFDRGGKPLGSLGAPGSYVHIELSPDDTQVAVENFDLETRLGDVWLGGLITRHHITLHRWSGVERRSDLGGRRK